MDRDFRPSSQGELGLTIDVGTQIALDDEPMVCRELGHDPLQQPDMGGAIAARAEDGGGPYGGQLERVVNPGFASSTISGLRSSPLRPHLPLGPRIGLDRDGPRFIHTDQAASRRWAWMMAPIFRCVPLPYIGEITHVPYLHRRPFGSVMRGSRSLDRNSGIHT